MVSRARARTHTQPHNHTHSHTHTMHSQVEFSAPLNASIGSGGLAEGAYTATSGLQEGGKMGCSADVDVHTSLSSLPLKAFLPR